VPLGGELKNYNLFVMTYTEGRKKQLQHEIDWIKNKLESVKKPKHRKDLERQIKEREYELHLGIFKK
jgi:hypothetical protein